MTNPIFTPAEGDRHAAATPLPIEIMTVKPSGFINYRGAVAAEHVDTVAASLKAYFEAEGRPEPVIYVRTLGSAAWVARENYTITIPDTPEGIEG